jgi:hypothetical protein
LARIAYNPAVGAFSRQAQACLLSMGFSHLGRQTESGKTPDPANPFIAADRSFGPLCFLLRLVGAESSVKNLSIPHAYWTGLDCASERSSCCSIAIFTDFSPDNAEQAGAVLLRNLCD